MNLINKLMIILGQVSIKEDKLDISELMEKISSGVQCLSKMYAEKDKAFLSMGDVVCVVFYFTKNNNQNEYKLLLS